MLNVIETEIEKLVHRGILDFNVIPKQDLAHLGDIILENPTLNNNERWKLLSKCCLRMSKNKDANEPRLRNMSPLHDFHDGEDGFIACMKIEIAMLHKKEISFELNKISKGERALA